MSKVRTIGRMVRRDIADDEGMARLSDGAARLYFYLLPWLDSFGKFSGGPGTIAETVVPLLGWSRKRILSYLAEINSHTSMRVWTRNGRFYVHDERFFEKQDIREDRRGRDTLPPYPGAERMNTGTSTNSVPEYIPDPLRDQVPPEVEVEVKDKEEVKADSPAVASGLVDPAPADRHSIPGNGNGSDDSGKGSGNPVIREAALADARRRLQAGDSKLETLRRLVSVFGIPASEARGELEMFPDDPVEGEQVAGGRS